MGLWIPELLLLPPRWSAGAQDSNPAASALLRSVLQHLPPSLTIAAHLLATLPQARGQRAFIGGPEAWVEVREQEATGRSTSALARPHRRLRRRD